MNSIESMHALSVLAAAGQQLPNSNHWQADVTLFLRQFATALGLDQINVYETLRNGHRLIHSGQDQPSQLLLPQFVVSELQQGRTVYLQHEQASADLKPFLKANGIACACWLPLTIDSRWRYTLSAYAYQHRDWNETEQALLQTAANLIGTILAHLQSAQELQQARQQLAQMAQNSMTCTNDMEAKLEELRESQEYIRFVLDSNSQLKYELLPNGTILDISLALQKMLGYTPSELIGRNIAELVHPDDLDRCAEFTRQVLETQQPQTWLEYRIQHQNGDWRWHASNIAPLMREHGRLRILVGIATDISRKKAEEELLRKNEEKIRTLLDMASDAIVVTDAETGIVVDANSMTQALLGQPLDAIRGMHQSELHPPAQRAEANACFNNSVQCGGDTGIRFGLLHRNGQTTPCEINSRLVQIDERKYMIGVFRDITERLTLEDNLRMLSITDPLTGSFNRRHFMEVAQQEIERSRRYRRPLSVLMIDIDHFKKINDRYGHKIGDKALQRFTYACLSVLRSHDIMARLGGEEFAILLPETDLPSAYTIAERLRDTLSHMRIATPKGSLHFTVSIGAARYDETESEIDDALARADHALYEAKHNGRNQVILADQIVETQKRIHILT